MNTQTQEALKMAIEALEFFQKNSEFCKDTVEEAIQACKEALAQPAQEHIGYYYPDERMACLLFKKGLEIPRDALPLYGSPVPSWQGLSDDEIEYWECLKAPPVHPDFINDDSWREFARCIEAALREKNDKG